MKKEIMAQDNGLNELNEFLVPKWEMVDPNGMEKFIAEMIIAKTMRVLPSDKLLIYAACVKNGKVSMLENMTQLQRENLGNFVAYLRNTFGQSLPEQRLAFESVKQMDDEPIMDFFARVERLYFRSKGIEKPNGANFTGWMQEDVSHAFRSGLRNNEIKRLLMLNSTTIQYEDLAKTAKNYAVSLRDINKVYSVNAVHNRTNEEGRHEENEPRRSRRMRTPYRK